MKGVDLSVVGAIILLVFIIVIVLLYPVPILQAFGLQRFEGLEKQIGTPGTVDFEAPPVTPYGPEIEREVSRIISEEPDTYYVSEIGCKIAKDIYEDFTTYGEKGRDKELRYVTPTDAFNENFNCEWVWDSPCCWSEPTEGRYKCLIGSGIFTVGSRMTMTVSDINSLIASGCSNCTYESGGNIREYELDEVCINHNLAIRYFPEGSATSFCTNDTNEYLSIEKEEQKFGNSYENIAPPVYFGCYVNPKNDDASWRDSCKVCNASGKRDDGTKLTERDYDRIYEWLADNNYNFKIVNDTFLKSNKPVVPGKKYFYTVYWNNDDEEIPKARGYEIEFPTVISYEFTDIEDVFNRVDFRDFVGGFFDKVSDSRKTSAGMWFSELRTLYDGIVTLTENVDLANIQNYLEAVVTEDKALTFLKPCTPRIDCNYYAIEEKPWAERTPLAGPLLIIEDEFPIYIRYSRNIDQTLISGERYRIIIRNWVSNWYHVENGEGCNDYWCEDRTKPPGEKIYCSSVSGPGCVSVGGGGAGENKKIYYRYADKSIIIIKLPTCTDTDNGIDYYNYGEVTVDEGLNGPVTDPDTCISGTELVEKYCSKDGNIRNKIYDCADGCGGGVCIATTTFDFRINTNPDNEITCQGDFVETTVTVEKISGTAENVQLTPSNMPPGTTVTFSPSDTGSPDPSFGATMRIVTTASTPPGEYYIKIEGTDGGKTEESEPYRLVVTEPKYKCDATTLSGLCLLVNTFCTTTEECINPIIESPPCCIAGCIWGNLN